MLIVTRYLVWIINEYKYKKIGYRGGSSKPSEIPWWPLSGKNFPWIPVGSSRGKISRSGRFSQEVFPWWSVSVQSRAFPWWLVPAEKVYEMAESRWDDPANSRGGYFRSKSSQHQKSFSTTALVIRSFFYLLISVSLFKFTLEFPTGSSIN